MTGVDGVLPAVGFGIYVLLLAAAALCDIWKFIVPNAIPVALTGLFLVAAWVLPGTVGWSSHLGAAALVLAVGFALFAWGRFGGGDVKLIAALSLWTGFDHLLDLLIAISIAGGALALALVLTRRLVAALRTGESGPPHRPLPRLWVVGESVPYAVAIAAGATFVGRYLPVFGLAGR